MFCDLPQTIIDELCMQYNLDNLDRALVELYIGLPERCRADIKSEIHKMIQKLGRWEVKYNENDNKMGNPNASEFPHYYFVYMYTYFMKL